jgi:SAM-dependent methyltransferase
VYEWLVKETYSAEEFDALWADVGPRSGWDVSRMRDTSVPRWNYLDVVRDHLTPEVQVLDVGTGGGERLIELSPHFRRALGLDTDQSMIETARLNAAHIPHIDFAVGDATLVSVSATFDVILNRQAPFDLVGVARHLRPGGWFITQQVGDRNMRNVMEALGRDPGERTISRSEVIKTRGLDLPRSMSTTWSTWSTTWSPLSSGCEPSICWRQGSKKRVISHRSRCSIESSRATSTGEASSPTNIATWCWPDAPKTPLHSTGSNYPDLPHCALEDARCR